MTSSLERSYGACALIAKRSGSNFVRSFDLLREDRRRAMYALYAFSRLADDATDSLEYRGSQGEPAKGWSKDAWLAWVDGLTLSDETAFRGQASLAELGGAYESHSKGSSEVSQWDCGELGSIREALIDSIQRFSIPQRLLKEIVAGVDRDVEFRSLKRFVDLQHYMDQVASAVGLCCLAIWSEEGLPAEGSELWQHAVDCGHAFQLTNILRDVVEDAKRGRVYFATEDMERFGIKPQAWGEALSQAEPKERIERLGAVGDWEGLLRVYQQRAEGCYASGWEVAKVLPADSLRMFSMMWETYHSLLSKVVMEPRKALMGRVRLGSARKAWLIGTHVFTPWFKGRLQTRTHRGVLQAAESSAASSRICLDQTRLASPRVAVIGGGLAGMQVAGHLARHGCQTVLYEARQRLGGRVGSFEDVSSSKPIDYCQHVGMKCCKELLRWIGDQGQRGDWVEQRELHFRSSDGKSFCVKAWPLPAPYHLAGLLLRWPDLSMLDRLSIARGLFALLRTKPGGEFETEFALEWLRARGQSESAINRFWTTILVSALGEQLPRVRMGAVRKVMVDGFAASRDAYHLFVPQRPLSELVDQTSQALFKDVGVECSFGSVVQGLERSNEGTWSVLLRAGQRDTGASTACGDSTGRTDSTGRMVRRVDGFDAVVIAVLWHRLGGILGEEQLSSLGWDEAKREAWKRASGMDAAPITGVHTWWSAAWLPSPHAILIDRMSQWVFPGVGTSETQGSVGAGSEVYYQVVISGSRDLPKGDTDSILRSVEQDLREVFPEIGRSGATMLRGRVVTDPQSVFSDFGSANGSTGSGRLPIGIGASNGLVFAGDWTETGWPATMEGALRSGSLAAECVLEIVGRPAQLALDQGVCD